MQTTTYDLHAELDEAARWLESNIRTTTDVEALAAKLDRIHLRFEAGGSRASSVQAALCHFFGGWSGWTSTANAAVERLREKHGRFWNYAGD